MAVHLVCLTNEGGVPLFTRTKGDVKTLAFAEQGMLYGVQMFAQNHGVKLESTTTEEAKVIWKVFHDSVTLVLVTSNDGSCDVHFNTLLNHIFHAMVMFIGLDTLVSIRNVEKLRREIKVCYPVIDALLQESDMFGALSSSVDVLISPENTTLQDPLEAYVTSADSTFGCLHADGKLVVATSNWWSLSGQEMMLVAKFIQSLPVGTSSDVPIYLPHASPKDPHRLLSIHLLPGVVVSVLCYANPTLAEAEEQLIEPSWRSHHEALRAIQRAPPSNIPRTIPLDAGILGYVLVNTDQHKCLSSMHLPLIAGGAAEMKPLPPYARREILTSFYRTVAGGLFPPSVSPERQDSSGEAYKSLPHTAEETYMCGDDYKTYALNSGGFQFYVLFSSAVPQYALRSVTKNLLGTLSKEKIFVDRRAKSS
ncbi:protein fuzzy homolog [Lytechinus variegatus]|uniref:protein fuzzy homolog n=1 Tax=Lytechinus variegatus TaxID=7654 RepID=UPI001BB280EC|nr:protein fuzzy homolog [Lytechinus variegatus]